MLEQYSFWGYLPSMIDSFAQVHKLGHINVSILTFIAISSGSVGSFVTGWGTKYITSSFTAALSISASALCGILHPIFYGYPSLFLYMLLLFVWGWNVTSDSPQFSALASRACKPELLGTALTVYNCIGYFITILSIQLCQALAKYISMQYVSLVIAIGPLVGAWIIFSRARAEGIWLVPEGWKRKIIESAAIDTEEVLEMRRMTVSPKFEIAPLDDEDAIKTAKLSSPGRV
jgi:hypothetical protein